MSIRSRLIFLVLFATLLPAVLIGLRFFQDRAEDVELAQRRLAEASDRLSLKIANAIQSTSQLHYGLARATDLDTDDKNACSAFLLKVLEANPQYTGILTINPDGQLFCNSLSNGRTLDLRDRHYFRQALVTTEGVTLESAFGRLTGKAVLQIAYPARSESGELKFVLLASLDLDNLVKQFIIENPSALLEISLTDKKGTVLVGMPSEKWQDQVGKSIAETNLFQLSETHTEDATQSLRGPDGSEQVWAFSNVPQVRAAGLHVQVGMSKESLVRVPNHRLYQNLFFLLVFFLVFFAGTLWLVDRGIHKPALRIARMVETLGSGDLTARITAPFPRGEIGGIMAVLNTTAESLEKQRADIVDLNSKLTASEAKLKDQFIIIESALNNMSQGLCMFDAERRLVICNRKFSEMYQLEKELTKPGTPLANILSYRAKTGSYSKDPNVFIAERINIVALDRHHIDIVEQEDGRTIEILFNPLPGGGWISTHEDITARKSLEKQLHHAQKMEAIGNLTGGVAHDFNNLLSIIIGNLDSLRALPPDAASIAPQLNELTSEALEAAIQGADLTRQLLSFARRQTLRPERIDINEYVSGVSRMLRRTLGEDIKISLNLGKEVWPIYADPAQLSACLINIGNNARDAMPKGGALTIATSNQIIDQDYISAQPKIPPGNYTLIELSDTGSGIAPETLDQVFEPFFTTKEQGKGTGLGLSMVFGFVKQSGGHITVYSEVGQGTTFRIYLPTAASDARTEEKPIISSIGGRETILAVEDNEGLRRVVVRQLKELGYRVLEANNGPAALKMLESGKVDLLFSDIVMPEGLSGYDLANEALTRWPRLKVLLTSGFAQNKHNGRSDPRPNIPILTKPYRKDDLALALRKVIEAD